jgi:hypothetical protein
MWSYPAKYRDKLGEVTTTIQNDGKTLRMVVRGIEFCGRDFDALEPTDQVNSSKLADFTLQQGCLCSCVIDCEMRVPVAGASKADAGLTIHLELGEPKPNGGFDREDLHLSLELNGTCVSSSGTSGWFEGELLDIQRQLPDGVYLSACINCAFSDYSPVGHGLFGDLACFRDYKDGYRSVRTKADLFRIWETMTEFVQETYLCREFERRRPGTGYRG